MYCSIAWKAIKRRISNDPGRNKIALEISGEYINESKYDELRELRIWNTEIKIEHFVAWQPPP